MRLRYAAAGLVAGLVLATVASGKAHAVAAHPSKSPRALERQLVKAVRHTSYVCANGKRGAWWTRGHCRRGRWARASLERLRAARAARERASRTLAATSSIQAAWIAAATELAGISRGDPWPNCPDPWSGGSWSALKDCESRGYPWTVCGTPSGFVGPLQFAYSWRWLWRKHGIPC